MHQEDPSELIERCISGDDVARAQFIEEHGETIRKAASIRMRDLSDPGATELEVDDVYHEVLLRIFENDCRALRHLHKPTSLRAWLMAITNNQILSKLRKESTARTKRLVLAREVASQSARSVETSAVRGEEHQALIESIDTLAADEQLVLNWYYLEDMKYYEIAESLGISINTVASKLRRAKQKLREKLIERLR